MQISSAIQKAIDYVDENVLEPLSSEQLAEIAAFSKSHFFKLFTLTTGYTPMNYVIRRKLTEAAYQLITTQEKIVDIAFKYGFESHDVFSRAFKRLYGVTPESYRKRRYILREMKKLKITLQAGKGRDHVNVEMIERPAMKFLGIERRVGDGEGEASIARIWELYFEQCEQLIGGVTNRVRPDDDYEYALCSFDHDGKLHYFIGFEVEDLDYIPTGATGRIVPATKFAKATHLGPPAETLGQTIDYVYGEWFESQTYDTGHQVDCPYAVIEYYDQRCSLNPPEMDIFIPLRDAEFTIEQVPAHQVVCYQAVGDDLAKLKYEAFDRMINWVEKHVTGGKTPFKLQVKYGETGEHQSYCEIAYALDQEISVEPSDVKVENRGGGLYAVGTGVHHFLEKCWGSFFRNLDKNASYAPVGGCYEQYIIENGKVDYYTPVLMYERVEAR